MYFSFEDIAELVVYSAISLVFIFFLKWFFSSNVEPEALQIPKRTRALAEKRNYSLEELKQYDGQDKSKPILVCVKGQIFDISRGEAFYGMIETSL